MTADSTLFNPAHDLVHLKAIDDMLQQLSRYRNEVAQRLGMPSQPTEGLVPAGGSLTGHEFEMTLASDTVWITVDTVSVSIKRTSEGVMVDLWPLGCESEECFATAAAEFADAEAALMPDEYDLDDVAEWVGQHYAVNFDACSRLDRADWIRRFRESHDC